MVKQVIKVVDLVSRFEKKPSLKIFNSILNVLVMDDIDLARWFYRKRMMGNGVKGDDYTFGILMKGLCLLNSPIFWDRACFQLSAISQSKNGLKSGQSIQ
jgi:hypothetical protein